MSVLTTVRNGAVFLPAFLANLRAQVMEPLQFVVVDDFSDDGTAEILRQAAAADPRFTVCRSDEPGRGNALNTGLELCRHDYVAIQDVDDLSVSWRLDYCRRLLDRNPHIALIGSDAIERTSLADLPSEPSAPDPDHPDGVVAVSGELRYTTPFVHSSVMLRRRALLAVGGYDARRRAQFDFDLYLRLLAAGHGLYRAPVPMAVRLCHASWFEGRHRLTYRLGSARLRYRALREIDGPLIDWLAPPLVVAGAFVPRRLWTFTKRRFLPETRPRAATAKAVSP